MVMLGSGDEGRKELRAGTVARKFNFITFVSTSVMRMASLGQACTHAGGSPTARRLAHMSHLRTMPRFTEYCGTSYGHFITQYWQPMHWSSRCRTMPVTGSLSYASTGQPSRQPGSTQ